MTLFDRVTYLPQVVQLLSVSSKQVTDKRSEATLTGPRSPARAAMRRLRLATVAYPFGAFLAVWSRRGALFNDRFPRIAEAVGALPVDNALIDGEAVVFLPDGHSDFAALLTKAGGEQASFVAFDLLSLESDDLRQRPLEERRDELARLAPLR